VWREGEEGGDGERGGKEGEKRGGGERKCNEAKVK